MILPQELEKIRSVNDTKRRRDYLICQLYIEGLNANQIEEQGTFGLTSRRISKILYNNREYISGKIAWDKDTRIHKRQAIARRLSGRDRGTRDETDALDALQKEIEGDKLSGSGSSQQIVIFQIIQADEKGEEIAHEDIRTSERSKPEIQVFEDTDSVS
jgi:hypothetical protein